MENDPLLRPRSRDEFEIAIICALPVERDAVEALLEVEYETDGFSYRKAEGDTNTYTTGRLGNQHVVLAYMPGMGTVSAAAVASNLRISFRNIKLGLVTGICGGATETPAEAEILLGDVIVSRSVIQIDFGRQYPHRFIRKKEVEDTVGRASPEIRAFVEKMSGYLVSTRLKAKTNRYSSEICSRKGFLKSAYPGPEKDHLYPADMPHKHWEQGVCSICDSCNTSGDDVCEEALRTSCKELGCDRTKLVERYRLREAVGTGFSENQPLTAEMKDARKASIHFGRIACGNQVMKSGQDRIRIATEERVIGFEMESAGTWDYIPTIVIKSVCDYADSHEDKHWQAYAATTAAACTKAVLEEWRGVDKPAQNPVNHGVTNLWKLVYSLFYRLLTNRNLSYPNDLNGAVSKQDTYPVHWTVTRPGNALFTGREDILCELKSIVCNAANTPSLTNRCSIVISGMGGQGKSEICLQLANRVRESFWGIFWVDVSTPSLAQAGFRHIAARLCIQVQTWQDARQGLANIKEPWLLVLDNADDPSVEYQEYFPTGMFGVVILTTRNPDCQQYATVKFIDLEGLEDAKSCELLLKAARVSPDLHQTLKDDASRVVKLLKSHPLALIQAGSYVSRGHCTLKDYPEVFNQQQKRLLAFPPSQAHSRYRDVYTTFEASAEMIQSSSTECGSDALDLLSSLALCSSKRLPIALLVKAAWDGAHAVEEPDDGDMPALASWHVSHLLPLVQIGSTTWDSFRLIEAIHLLRACWLLSTDTYESLRVSLHPLVRTWAASRLDEKQRHEYWVATGCLFAFSWYDINLWYKYSYELEPHLQGFVLWDLSDILGTEPADRLMISRTFVICGRVLAGISHGRELDALYKQARHLCAILGLNPSRIDQRWIDIYELLADCSLAHGTWESALSLREEIVEIYKQSLPENHPKLLKSQEHLAAAYYNTVDDEKAALLLEQILTVEELPPKNLFCLQLLLAAIYHHSHRMHRQVKKAIPLYERVLKHGNHVLSEQHPLRLGARLGLAEAYAANFQTKEAASLLEKLVADLKQSKEHPNPDLERARWDLATTYKANGQKKEAISIIEDYIIAHWEPLGDREGRKGMTALELYDIL